MKVYSAGRSGPIGPVCGEVLDGCGTCSANGWEASATVVDQFSALLSMMLPEAIEASADWNVLACSPTGLVFA